MFQYYWKRCFESSVLQRNVVCAQISSKKISEGYKYLYISDKFCLRIIQSWNIVQWM